MSQAIQYPFVGTREKEKSLNGSARVQSTLTAETWQPWQLNLFRFAFLYFFIQCVPLDWKYYADVFAYSTSQYGFLFKAARYYPRFTGTEDTYLNWVIAGVIAGAGTIVWARIDKNKTEYNNLYYWLRVIVRYRLAAAVLAYGFIKLFPIQAPYPSLSNLNTLYGDFTHWKVFSVSLGAAPIYEKFLGIVEILAGLLLLNRKTATIGAFLIIAFSGNVFLSNLAYEGGEDIYSLYIVVLALFLVVFDAKRIWTLVSQHRGTSPNKYNPVFTGAFKFGRIAIKSAFILAFFFLYGYQTNAAYHGNHHTEPATAGLAGAQGIYDVKEFYIQGEERPYSLTDPVRWKDVVFEKWATISIRSNRPVIADTVSHEIIPKSEEEKLYESAGTSGRHFYTYTVDNNLHQLVLRNKNTHYKGEILNLNFSQPEPGVIVLTGLDENKKHIRVRLEKINKKYLFPLGRKKSIKL